MVYKEEIFAPVVRASVSATLGVALPSKKIVVMLCFFTKSEIVASCAAVGSSSGEIPVTATCFKP